MKIKIAKMQPEHIPALAVIEQQCFHTPWSENALGRRAGREWNPVPGSGGAGTVGICGL